MRQIRKQKTKSALKARFKVTKTGKILRRSQNMRHLRRRKRAGAIRGYRVPKQIKGKFAAKFRRVMGVRRKKQKTKSKKS